MEGLNTEVVRTPGEAPYFSAESHFGVANAMVAEDPEHTHLLN